MSILEGLQSLIEAKRALQEKKAFATVVFADLSGSTAYKERREPIDALAKTYLHNTIVTVAILEAGGKVIKYIGDEAMGFFAGDAAVLSAVKAAVVIQERIADYNDTQRLTGEDALHSKLGINSGDVYFFKFPGHEPEDPQGLTVDLAARVVSLAKPDQILITGNTYGCCAGADIQCSEPFSREIRGLKTPVEIYEVLWDGSRRGVAETVHASDDSPQVRAALEDAYQAEVDDRTGEAVRHLENALVHDPLHFSANLRLAQIYLRGYVDAVRANQYCAAALKSNPLSPRAKLTACIIPWHVDAKVMDEPSLSKLIEELEGVLNEALHTLDYDLEFLVRNALAYYLAMRYQMRRRSEDLNGAIRHCRVLAFRSQWILRYQTAAFYDTYAFVLSRSDDPTTLEGALKWAEKAAEASDPATPYPWELIGEIKRKLLEARRIRGGST